ncbi:MAG: hypothetical protein KJO35_00930 [Gammaproteobacteria bacterium]|nr:hypothetical protein [Gammaproteobacteria bacterium]
MKIRICAALVSLCLSLPALADLTTKIRAVELSTSNLQVPTTPSGRLMFKPCSGICKAKYESARLTAETRFTVNNADTDFLGFRQAFFNLSRDTDHYALVSYDPKANTITSVLIAD